MAACCWEGVGFECGPHRIIQDMLKIVHTAAMSGARVGEMSVSVKRRNLLIYTVLADNNCEIKGLKSKENHAQMG